MKITGKPDVSAFLDGGKADKEKSPSPVPTPAPIVAPAETPRKAEKPATAPKRQKLVELPEPVFEALKDRAYEEYKKTGKRVTETQIIIDALSKYLGLK